MVRRLQAAWGMDRSHSLSGLTWLAIVLVVIGALNWGLVGLFGFNLVAAIFGRMSWLARLVYILVALAGIYLIAVAPRFTRRTPTAAV